MTNSIAKSICKWVSIVLVLLALIVFMNGGIRIANKKEFKEFKKELSKELSSIGIYSLDDLDEDDIDEDDLENMQELLDGANIDLEAEDMIKALTKGLKAVNDGKMSMKEYASVAPKYKKIADVVFDAMIEEEYVDEEDIEEAEEMINKNKLYTTFPVVMYYITLLCGLVVIVLHFINHKLPGISITVINFIWVIVLAVATNKLNIEMEDEFEMDPGFLKLTGGPVWAFIFALLAMLIWIYRDNIAAKLSNSAIPVSAIRPVVGQMTSNGSISPESVIKCNNCGNVLNPGAIFCPMCGSKYEAPAEQVVSVAPSHTEVQPQIHTPRNCPGCGAILDEDAVFCGMCGYKLDVQ